MSLEQSAAAFRLGFDLYRRHPAMACERWFDPDARWRFKTLDDLLTAAPGDFRDGWEAARREAEVEARIDSGEMK